MATRRIVSERRESEWRYAFEIDGIGTIYADRFCPGNHPDGRPIHLVCLGRYVADIGGAGATFRRFSDA